MLETLLPYVGGAIALIAALLGYGRYKERAGARKERDKAHREDMENAQDISKRAAKARRESAADDRSADERLRQHKRLRD